MPSREINVRRFCANIVDSDQTHAPVMFGFLRWVIIKCRLTGCMTSNLVGHI